MDRVAEKSVVGQCPAGIGTGAIWLFGDRQLLGLQKQPHPGHKYYRKSGFDKPNGGEFQGAILIHIEQYNQHFTNG